MLANILCTTLLPTDMFVRILSTLPLALAAAVQTPFRADAAANAGEAGPKVNVTLNVMSRCPDAVRPF